MYFIHPDVRNLITSNKLTDDQAISMIQLKYKIVKPKEDCIYGANDYVGINYQNEHGGTALMIASIEDDRDIVRFLLSQGADPNIRDDGGDRETALMYASHHDNEEIVRILTSFGGI